jgi:hypothetical protein
MSGSLFASPSCALIEAARPGEFNGGQMGDVSNNSARQL